MAQKNVTKKPATASKKKKTSGSPLKARTPVKKPAVRYSPGGKGKSAKAKPIGQMGLRKPASKPKAKDVPENFVQVPKSIINRESTLVKRVNKGLRMTKKQLVDLGKVARINAEAITVNKKNYMSKAKLDKLKKLDEATHLRRAKRDLEGLGYTTPFFKKKPKSDLTKLKSKKVSSRKEIMDARAGFMESMKRKKEKK